METAKECLENMTRQSAYDIFGAYLAKTEKPVEGEPPWFHVLCRFTGKKRNGFISLVLPRSESKRMINQLAKSLGVREKDYDGFIASCMYEYVNTIAGSVVVNEEILEHFGRIRFMPPAHVLEEMPEANKNEILSMSFKTDSGSPILISVSVDE